MANTYYFLFKGLVLFAAGLWASPDQVSMFLLAGVLSLMFGGLFGLLHRTWGRS